MKCKECGACCSLITVPLWLYHHSKDTETLLKWRGCIIEDNVAYIPAECKYLVDGKCSIYKDRPERCKAFEAGSKSCVKIRQINNRFKRKEAPRHPEEKKGL